MNKFEQIADAFDQASAKAFSRSQEHMSLWVVHDCFDNFLDGGYKDRTRVRLWIDGDISAADARQLRDWLNELFEEALE